MQQLVKDRLMTNDEAKDIERRCEIKMMQGGGKMKLSDLQMMLQTRKAGRWKEDDDDDDDDDVDDFSWFLFEMFKCFFSCVIWMFKFWSIRVCDSCVCMFVIRDM